MLLILFIFITANIVRFLYFPDNVYFAFDQARDSFASLEILRGDLKIVGPPSFLNDKIFPGPLIFYIYAPIYLIFNKSPEAASAVFRIWNSLGVFLTFAIGSILFNKRAGIIAALLFAFSYEESQYSLFLSHQPLAVITILLFYLGLSIYFFKRKPWGLMLTAAGLGLSIQFHYGYVFLVPTFIAYIIIFRKRIKHLYLRWVFSSLLLFILTISTFILTEIKYHFISNLIFHHSTEVQFFSGFHFKQTLFVVNRFLHDSFLANYQFTPAVGLIFIIATIYLLYQKQLKDKIFFLVIWFIFGLSLYLLYRAG
ncbi:glycosyltransferase family 39 protein [Patescibacteria group bacterium]|nr:glycosyltransferase family 39 protein [Patescibacteria group bacterium]